jgi:hypothetical protein
MMYRLEHVRQAVAQSRSIKFTCLHHHLTLELLRSSFEALNPYAAPGVDGVGSEEYAEQINDNIQELFDKVQRGTYRPLPGLWDLHPEAGWYLAPSGHGNGQG